jgi:hypothetical protein
VYNRQHSRLRTVTIAIPSLHRPDLTTRCIEFIQEQTLQPDEWEVIVIENEAQRDSILPDPLPRNTRRLELPRNEGTTGSINRAIQASDSRYVLLLNNDVELEPDYLEKLVHALDADERLGFATGKLLRATQRTHLDGAGDAMLMAGAGYRLGHYDVDLGQFNTRARILAGCGAAVLYRRSVFQLAGALDEDFFAYLDDLDLSLRTYLAGKAGGYVPAAVAFHVGSATLGDVLHPHVIEYITRNQIWILAKDYPASALIRLLPRIFLYQSAWFLFAVRSGGLSAYFRGLIGAFHGLPKMLAKRKQLAATRQISDPAFVALLRDSERQIYDWQQSQPQQERSALLKLYFRIFGRP